MPTLTSGILSKVITHQNKIVMLQSTAAVHSGNSGGALLDEKGNFLGLLTCNITQSNGKIIPKINLSIPVSELRPLLQFCLEFPNEDLSHIQQMEIRNEHLSKLWRLEDFPPVPTVNKSNFQSYLNNLKPKL